MPTSLRRLSLFLCFIALFSARAASPAPKAPLSDALKAARPKGGEHFGLYLLDKKVGYAFNDLSLANGTMDKAKAVSEFFFRAHVGDKVSERLHTDVPPYESKPSARLLIFTIADTGHGGDH